MTKTRSPFVSARTGRLSRRFAVTVLAVAAAMTLAGCFVQPTDSPAERPTTQSTQSATVAPPASEPKTFAVNCSYEDPSLYDPTKADSTPMDAYVQERLPSYQAAWDAGKPWSSCEGFASGGDDYTGEQVAAAKTAGYDSVESVDTLYALCAEVHGFYVTDGPSSEGQQAEVAGMLMICPDFPAAEQLGAASALAQQAEQERAQGTRFWGAGVYLIGQDVQPGTYQATGDIRGCYWSRLDAAGEIIDNNFVSAATQVQLTVESSDFSLEIDGGCGEFVKVG